MSSSSSSSSDSIPIQILPISVQMNHRRTRIHQTRWIRLIQAATVQAVQVHQIATWTLTTPSQ